MKPVLLTPRQQVEIAAVIAELSQVLERSLRGEKIALLPIRVVAKVCRAVASKRVSKAR